MMKQALPLRSEIPEEQTWDVSAIFENEADYNNARNNLQDSTELFVKEY